MTKLVDRPNSSRGQRRRDQLVDAGVELLAEGGWPAVTTRAVAERSGANQGLIHYHFGGLPGLHVAIARHAGDMIIAPVVDAVLAARDVAEAIDTLRGLLPATTGNERVTHLAVELIAGASRDPALGDVFRDTLRQAREQIAARLHELNPELREDQRAGAATLIAALIDGLMLHLLLDPELPADTALDTLRELTTTLAAKERP